MSDSSDLWVTACAPFSKSGEGSHRPPVMLLELQWKWSVRRSVGEGTFRYVSVGLQGGFSEKKQARSR